MSLWVLSRGQWCARDPFTRAWPLDYAGGGRFPPSELDQPRHEDGTVESLREMARALSAGPSRRDGRVDLMVRCLAPGARRKAVFHAEGRLRGEIVLRRRHLPLREGKCGDVDAQQRLLDTLLDDLLGKGLLPDPAEFHLTRNGPALHATGFSPERYLEDVAMVADPEGRPVSIIWTRSGDSRSTSLRYARKDGRRLLSGWTRQSAEGRESGAIRWRMVGRGWLPARVEIERPAGTWLFTFTSW